MFMTKYLARVSRRPVRALALLAALNLWQPGLMSAERETTPATSPTEQSQSTGESKAEDTKCFQGCLRWGKLCNVDPRVGTYKCRRRCEKFGEICE